MFTRNHHPTRSIYVLQSYLHRRGTAYPREHPCTPFALIPLAPLHRRIVPQSILRRFTYSLCSIHNCWFVGRRLTLRFCCGLVNEDMLPRDSNRWLNCNGNK